ncbi:MAG: hypothetical protein AAF798_00220 [Bacteroidota bacterium]
MDTTEHLSIVELMRNLSGWYELDTVAYAAVAQGVAMLERGLGELC